MSTPCEEIRVLRVHERDDYYREERYIRCLGDGAAAGAPLLARPRVP
jgi:hypothetical protein